MNTKTVLPIIESLIGNYILMAQLVNPKAAQAQLVQTVEAEIQTWILRQAGPYGPLLWELLHAQILPLIQKKVGVATATAATGGSLTATITPSPLVPHL